MPARAYLGINADDQAEIETIAVEALRAESPR
jgi:phage gpG-like protein